MGTSTGEGPGTLPRNIFRDDITYQCIHWFVESQVCHLLGGGQVTSLQGGAQGRRGREREILYVLLVSPVWDGDYE